MDSMEGEMNCDSSDNKDMNINHFLLWLPMIVIAIINGTIRQLFFIKSMNELRAHQLSTITLILFCSIYLWFVFPILDVHSITQALFIGFIWTLLTISFEFLLGRLTNKSWTYLLQDYNIAKGHIWPIFLISLFLLPCLLYLIKNK